MVPVEFGKLGIEFPVGDPLRQRAAAKDRHGEYQQEKPDPKGNIGLNSPDIEAGQVQ